MSLSRQELAAGQAEQLRARLESNMTEETRRLAELRERLARETFLQVRASAHLAAEDGSESPVGA